MPPRFWVLRTISKPKKQKNQFAQPNRTGIHKDPHYVASASVGLYVEFGVHWKPLILLPKEAHMNVS